MIIKINNYVLRALHGATTKEKINPQDFRIDVSVVLPEREKTIDNVDNVFDYRIIKNIIKETIEGKFCELIETLAEKMADQIIVHKEIISVDVTISKLTIWENGFPSVTVTRTNADL